MSTMNEEADLQLQLVKDAPWARRGEYGLTPEAAAVFWYLHATGVWEPGHHWFRHVDIRLTSDSAIMLATSLSEGSVRLGLAELEGKGVEFIIRKPRFYNNGMQGNDAIEFLVPADWCQDCGHRKQGAHECHWDDC